MHSLYQILHYVSCWVKYELLHEILGINGKASDTVYNYCTQNQIKGNAGLNWYMTDGSHSQFGRTKYFTS